MPDRDTLPPSGGPVSSAMAPEAVEALLGRVHATVEIATVAAQNALAAAKLARSAAAHNADALIEHTTQEHLWMGRIERNLELVAERQRLIPTIALVLSGVAVVVALLALVASLWVSTRAWTAGVAVAPHGATSGQRLAVARGPVVGSLGGEP